MHLRNAIIKHSRIIIPVIITTLIPVTSGCHSADVTDSSSIYNSSGYITSQEDAKDSFDTSLPNIKEDNSKTNDNSVTTEAGISNSDNNNDTSDTDTNNTDSDDSLSSPDAGNSDSDNSDSDDSHSSPDTSDADSGDNEGSGNTQDSSGTDDSNQEDSNPNSWINNLSASANHNQLIIVSANGSRADVSMYGKTSSSTWETIVSASGFVGMEGVGTASEYASRTPAGIFSLSLAFGVNSNPGTSLPYTHVDSSHYWVDDPDSAYYNQFVSTDNISPDWSSAEHIVDYPGPYAYAIAIDYNTSCVKGAGSAIFLHCSNGRATYGCVSVPTQTMITILNNINPGCAIIIDNEWNITNY